MARMMEMMCIASLVLVIARPAFSGQPATTTQHTTLPPAVTHQSPQAVHSAAPSHMVTAGPAQSRALAGFTQSPGAAGSTSSNTFVTGQGRGAQVPSFTQPPNFTSPKTPGGGQVTSQQKVMATTSAQVGRCWLDTPPGGYYPCDSYGNDLSRPSSNPSTGNTPAASYPATTAPMTLPVPPGSPAIGPTINKYWNGDGSDSALFKAFSNPGGCSAGDQACMRKTIDAALIQDCITAGGTQSGCSKALTQINQNKAQPQVQPPPQPASQWRDSPFSGDYNPSAYVPSPTPPPSTPTRSYDGTPPQDQPPPGMLDYIKQDVADFRKSAQDFWSDQVSKPMDRLAHPEKTFRDLP